MPYITRCALDIICSKFMSDCDHEHLYSMFKLKNRFPSNALTCLVIVSRFVRLPGNSLDIHNEGGGSTMLF